MRDQVCLQ